jgi:zinc D-Ala-D-Ala dipeptidase
MNKRFLKGFVYASLSILATALIISCSVKSDKGTNGTVEDKLVDVLSVDSTIILDLRYATDNNFLGKAVYSVKKCFLLEEAALKLSLANQLLRRQGYGIKVFDGYRPHSVQKKMWKIYPNPTYVADPARGSHHNRGCAVDVSLVDSLGNDIIMPTEFDDFTEKASHGYMELPEEAIKNRELLKKAMEDAGFISLQSEWWHYSTPGCSENELLDIPLK